MGTKLLNPSILFVSFVNNYMLIYTTNLWGKSETKAFTTMVFIEGTCWKIQQRTVFVWHNRHTTLIYTRKIAALKAAFLGPPKNVQK